MQIESVLANFDLPPVRSVEVLSNGNINKSFKIICADSSYILQQINNHVFPCVDELMNNIVLVTEHIRKINPNGMHVLRTKEGKSYYQSEDGYFRIYNFIEHSKVYNTIGEASAFCMAGIGFGRFQNELSDFDASLLYDVIPNFHNTSKRLSDFKAALAADAFGRAAECGPEIEYLLQNANLAGIICDGLADGSLPLRVTHNDTKINNILFDCDSGDPICAIDLDTVMKGSVLFDFGDAVRSGANRLGEITDQIDKVELDLELFRAFSEGFLSETRDILTPAEINLLPQSVAVLTYELALRFLEDYLRGDVYFGAAFDKINLVRARVQIALLANILNKIDDMQTIIQNITERSAK